MQNKKLLTIEQLQELNDLMNRGDRTGYYVKYYEFTGSQQTVDMAQISSFSDLLGGTAEMANKVAEIHPNYPKEGVLKFSEKIAKSHFDEVVKAFSESRLLTELEIVQVARNVWNKEEIGTYFPGNFALFKERIIEGKIEEAFNDPLGVGVSLGIGAAGGIMYIGTLGQASTGLGLFDFLSNKEKYTSGVTSDFQVYYLKDKELGRTVYVEKTGAVKVGDQYIVSGLGIEDVARKFNVPLSSVAENFGANEDFMGRPIGTKTFIITPPKEGNINGYHDMDGEIKIENIIKTSFEKDSSVVQPKDCTILKVWDESEGVVSFEQAVARLNILAEKGFEGTCVEKPNEYIFSITDFSISDVVSRYKIPESNILQYVNVPNIDNLSEFNPYSPIQDTELHKRFTIALPNPNAPKFLTDEEHVEVMKYPFGKALTLLTNSHAQCYVDHIFAYQDARRYSAYEWTQQLQQNIFKFVGPFTCRHWAAKEKKSQEIKNTSINQDKFDFDLDLDLDSFKPVLPSIKNKPGDLENISFTRIPYLNNKMVGTKENNIIDAFAIDREFLESHLIVVPNQGANIMYVQSHENIYFDLKNTETFNHKTNTIVGHIYNKNYGKVHGPQEFYGSRIFIYEEGRTLNYKDLVIKNYPASEPYDSYYMIGINRGDSDDSHQIQPVTAVLGLHRYLNESIVLNESWPEAEF